MYTFTIGDLVEVKKDKDLSPSLRFFHNRKGMIIKRASEGYHLDNLFVEWVVMFPDNKTAIFKDYELEIVVSVSKDD